MSLLDGRLLRYRSALMRTLALWRSSADRWRASERGRAAVERGCAAMVWAVLVGSLVVVVTTVLGMPSGEIALAGFVNGAGAAVYVYFFA